MTTTHIPAGSLSDDLMEKWSAWQSAQPHLHHPFLSAAFIKAFGEFNKQVRILLFEQEGETVGFFPFEAHRFGVARSVGYGLIDLQAPIFHPDVDFRSLDFGRLFAANRIDVFEFDRLIPEYAYNLSPLHHQPVIRSVIDISSGWDVWLKQKREASKSRFKRIPQKLHKATRELGEVSFTFESVQHADLDQLIEWKSDQYRRTCRSDRFRKKWFVAFLHHLLDLDDPMFRVVMSRFDTGDRTIALDLGLAYGDVLAGWFPTYDPEVARYSPGLLCWMKRIEAAANAGFSFVDLGVGEADYKDAFRDSTITALSGWTSRASVSATLCSLHRKPKREIERFVLTHPHLRRFAHETLNQLGQLRSRRHFL